MSKIIKLDSNQFFKNENLENWKKVSDFWLNGDLSQKKDLIDFIREKIEKFSEGKKSLRILDVGCGDGWILRILNSIPEFDFHYTGLDFNVKFITHLDNNFNSSNIEFVHGDIEEDISFVNGKKYDLIINSFSLFEMPSYDMALINESKILKNQGSILVFSIDPLSQLMAISETQEEFTDNCKVFGNLGKEGYCQKLVDTGHGFADYKYYGILHSISNYLSVLRDLDFVISDLDEINLIHDVVPKIYQYVEFNRV